MEKGVDSFWNDEEVEGSKRGTLSQPSTHWEPATQRSLRNGLVGLSEQGKRKETNEEPVSRMTLKETGGVPIANDPKYLRGGLRKQSDRQHETDIRQVFAFVSESLRHDR